MASSDSWEPILEARRGCPVPDSRGGELPMQLYSNRLGGGIVGEGASGPGEDRRGTDRSGEELVASHPGWRRVPPPIIVIFLSYINVVV